jgi:Bacterial PH domain
MGSFMHPPELHIDDDRVELIETDRLFRKNRRSMRFDQVAQVALRQGPMFSRITIESTGGHTFTVTGLPAGDAAKVKAEIERSSS